MYIVLEHRVFHSAGSVALQRLFTPSDRWALRPEAAGPHRPLWEGAEERKLVPV